MPPAEHPTRATRPLAMLDSNPGPHAVADTAPNTTHDEPLGVPTSARFPVASRSPVGLLPPLQPFPIGGPVAIPPFPRSPIRGSVDTPPLAPLPVRGPDDPPCLPPCIAIMEPLLTTDLPYRIAGILYRQRPVCIKAAFRYFFHGWSADDFDLLPEDQWSILWWFFMACGLYLGTGGRMEQCKQMEEHLRTHIDWPSQKRYPETDDPRFFWKWSDLLEAYLESYEPYRHDRSRRTPALPPPRHPQEPSWVVENGSIASYEVWPTMTPEELTAIGRKYDNNGFVTRRIRSIQTRRAIVIRRDDRSGVLSTIAPRPFAPVAATWTRPWFPTPCFSASFRPELAGCLQPSMKLWGPYRETFLLPQETCPARGCEFPDAVSLWLARENPHPFFSVAHSDVSVRYEGEDDT